MLDLRDLGLEGIERLCRRIDFLDKMPFLFLHVNLYTSTGFDVGEMGGADRLYSYTFMQSHSSRRTTTPRRYETKFVRCK